jgi:hypothetical protein
MVRFHKSPYRPREAEGCAASPEINAHGEARIYRSTPQGIYARGVPKIRANFEEINKHFRHLQVIR